jgi:antitoxin MazE
MLLLLKTVAVKLFDRKLILTPVQRAYELEALVAGITPENRHGETDWGKSIGRETW